MGEYLSRHYLTIDAKGRLVLPGKHRRVAEAETGTAGDKLQFYLRDYDGGLSLYTERAWQPMVQHFLSFSNFDAKQRKVKRCVSALASRIHLRLRHSAPAPTQSFGTA